MNRNRLFTLFITLILIGSFVFPALSVTGQSREAAKPSNDDARLKALMKATRIVERYREGEEQKSKGRKQAAQKQERPQWVAEALSRSLEQLQQRKQKYGFREAEAEFRMIEAIKDGRGYMDVRLAQIHNGVEVFGGQLITHLNEQNALRSVSGRVFEEARINTTPKIDEAQAIESAKSALQHEGEFVEEPSARLVILPHRVMKNDKTAKGATLVYLVKLMVEQGEKAGDYQFFINAKNGNVVWKINARNSAFGVGGSLYSGVVELNVDFNPNTGFTLRDPDRGHSEVFDTLDNSLTDFARPFGPKSPAAWGNVGDTSNRETVAVDALFGLEKTWDYFSSAHGRWGTDGIGAGVEMFVHYVHPNDLGINGGSGTTNNAYGGQNRLYFGNGDGTAFGPLVSLDIVAHEYTHCLLDDLLPDDGFIYSGESGAVDESFADIFGTAIEFYTGSINGREPDYLIGEDSITPNTAGDALRDMANPMNFNQPDHYSNRYTGTDDNGGVHINSGIMNHVYYLLSEGGSHRNGTFVPSIGRGVAEYIFYNALARWLTPSSTLEDVAEATRQVAIDDFPDRSAVAAVELAWFAVGLFDEDDLYYSNPHFPNMDRGRIVLYEPVTGFAETGKLDYQNGLYGKLRNLTGSTGWTHIVSMEESLFYYNSASGLCAVGEFDEAGNHPATKVFYLKTLGKAVIWTHISYLGGGELYFYDSKTGKEMRLRLTPPGSASNYELLNISIAPGQNWTHVVNAQGFLLFYRRDTGGAMVWTQTGKKFYTFSPFWSIIIDCGIQTTGEKIGILFYNAVTGLYVVGDMDSAGNFTTRSSARWNYSFMRAGWSQIVRVQEGLFFYDAQFGDTMSGYLRSEQESDITGREPFQLLPDSIGYIPSLRLYQRAAACLAR